MQRAFYRFAPTNKIEVDTPRGKIYVFTGTQVGGRCVLCHDEYELASLFTGRRFEDEVRDVLLRTRGLSVSVEDLQAFIDKLHGLGLLEKLQPAAPAVRRPALVPAEGEKSLVPPRLRRNSSGRLLAPPGAQPGGHEVDFDVVPGNRRRTRGPAVARNRSFGSEPDPDFLDDVYETADAESEDATWWQPDGAEAGGGGRSGRPPVAARRAPYDVDLPAARAPQPRSGDRTSGVRLLLRIPVGWLLPLARPLAWAAWSGYLAAVLAALLGIEVFGLWFSRDELTRDLVHWFGPATLAHTMLLGILTLNLWSQLARASEFARRVGTTPPFGITLAFNILPVFAVDLSGLGQLKDVGAVRKVIGASLSAVATMCAASYATWFVMKSNGTSLPLVSLGIALIASVRLLAAFNPLGRSDGYFLMTLKHGVPDLRERAFTSLLCTLAGKPIPRAWEKSVPRAVLLLYGFAVLVYLAAIFVLLTIYAGGWLEHHWGGLGVVVFLSLCGLALSGPVLDARRRLANSAARRPQRPARTLRARLWSMTKATLVLGGLTTLGLLPYQYEPGGDFVLRALQTKRTDVRSLISGRVEKLLVREADPVTEGQLLAIVSGEEEHKNVTSTEASIRELKANLAKARAGATPEQLAVARQAVSTAKTRYEFSRNKAERYAQLRKSGFVAEQSFEDLRGEAEVHRESLLQAEKELAQLLAGTRVEEIEALEAAIEQQTANLEYHAQQQRHAEIRAPIAGYIVSGSLLTAAGNYLQNGDLFATIEDTSQLLAEVRVPQSDIGLVKIGASIRLKAWTLPDLQIRGVVASIAPSAEETETGKAIRVISEIDNRAGILKSGLTGYAKITGEEMPTALAFTRMLVRFVQLEFWSWLP